MIIIRVSCQLNAVCFEAGGGRAERQGPALAMVPQEIFF